MNHAFIINPEIHHTFENETEQMEKCKEWSLLTAKASKTKAFFYKGNGMNLACDIIGFVDDVTAVIEFENKQKHCIHPSYLKEMQASSYSQKYTHSEEEGEVSKSVEQPEVEKSSDFKEASKVEQAQKVEVKPKEKVKKEKKPVTPKVQLPEEKVKMTAAVKEFITVPNHFSDDDDEVIIYDAVFIIDPETEIELAWSSHSKTMKKMELEIGDTLSFEAKIVKKKLTKHPVPYKINNPSKLQKI